MDTNAEIKVERKPLIIERNRIRQVCPDWITPRISRAYPKTAQVDWRSRKPLTLPDRAVI